MRIDEVNNKQSGPKMEQKYATRLAPTPSGFLHSGNLLNFRLIQHFQELTGAKLILRIDDLDSARVKDEYIEDIFRHVEWMGIKFDYGPSDLADFKKNYSQQLKTAHYKDGLNLLSSRGAELFHCRCSRQEIQKISPSGRYPGTCRKLALDSNEAPIIRFKTSSFPEIERESGDFVLWRRNQEPAYHLVNVLEDLDTHVNFVIRGEDLQESTKIHQALNSYINHAPDTIYYHHPIVSARDGAKLSKSQSNSSESHFYASGVSLKALEEHWKFFELARDLERFILDS